MEIRILVAGEQIGPYSATEVRRYLGQGLVSPSDLAVYEGMQEWQPLDHILAQLPGSDETITPDVPPESSGTMTEPILVNMYPEPPAATTEDIAPDMPPKDIPSAAFEATHEEPEPAQPPTSEVSQPAGPLPASSAEGTATEPAPGSNQVPASNVVLPESVPQSPAATTGETKPDEPRPATPALPETLLIMPNEKNIEEAPPRPQAEPASDLTATQKTKRKLNKIVIQPILPLEPSPSTALAQKRPKSGRTALTIEPPRPTTALPPVAGFTPKEAKEKKTGRNVVRTGPVSLGDLFDKPVVTTPAPVAQPPPKTVAAVPSPAPTSTPSSTPPLEAPKSPPVAVLPTLTPVLSKPEFPSSKAWVKGIPNGVIYACVGAAIFIACVVAFVLYLLMSGHDNGPNATNPGTAPPLPAEHASAPVLAPMPPVTDAAPQTAADFSARAAKRVTDNDLDGALADYDKALELDPKNLKTCYRRGLVRQTKGDLQGALADYNSVLSHDPKNADAFSNRGFIKQAQGDADGALADYIQALSLNPKISAAFYNVGLIKVQKGDLDGAIDAYNKALQLDPKMAIAYYNRGNAKNTEGNLDGAIADYTQALSLEPDIALAYCNRGFARQTKGDLDGALADYTQAVAINPKMAVAFYNRGLIKVQKGDLAGAVDDSSRAIDLDPKNAQAYCNRGLARMGKNDLDGAMADLRKFCEMAPNDTGADAARLYMWVITTKQNRKGTADPDLSTAVQNDWNSPPEDLSSKIATFLLGHIREKELIADAASPDQSREPGQYCKAWYFAGIKRLLAGDKQVAAADFRKCVATNQSTFCEYIFAKAELQAISPGNDLSAQAATP